MTLRPLVKSAKDLVNGLKWRVAISRAWPLVISTWLSALGCTAPAVEPPPEPTHASESAYNSDITKAGTSVGLTKADIAWHAHNTYGWDCEELCNMC